MTARLPEASPSPSRPSAPAPPRPGEIKRPAMRKPPEPKITKALGSLAGR